jgi:hypothetical protein
MKLVHLFGFVLFLGSIIAFVVVSSLTQNANITDIAFGRRIISTGTSVLTLPGIWMLAISGLWIGLEKYGIKYRSVQFKLLLVLVIISNAYIFIVPAAAAATQLAVQSTTQGQLLSDYPKAYLKESICGGVNVLLGIVAAIVGVWKMRTNSI